MISEILVGVVVGISAPIILKIIPDEFGERINQWILKNIYCRGNKRKYMSLMERRRKKKESVVIHKEDPMAEIIKRMRKLK